MPRLLVTNLAGVESEVEAISGLSLMENIRDNGFDELQAICGGQCACATCHVYVDPAFEARLSPMSDDEAAMIDGSLRRRENSRLSCQIRFVDELDGLRVTIAPEG